MYIRAAKEVVKRGRQGDGVSNQLRYIIGLGHHHLTVPISYNFFSHDSFLNDVILDISTISVEEHGIKLKN